MKNRLTVAWVGVAVVLGLVYTASAQTAQPVPQETSIAVTESPVVKLAGETDLYKDAQEPSPLDRKVSIRVSNVPISVFLNSITTQAKINFIMSEEFANKKVTASLTRVTVREALDTLLRVHGLAYQRIGKSDSYVVTKRSNDAPDTITKIYTLSYISLQGSSGTSVDTSTPATPVAGTDGSSSMSMSALVASENTEIIHEVL